MRKSHDLMVGHSFQVRYAIEGNWTHEGKFEASPVTSAPRGEFALSPGSFKQLKRGAPRTLWRSLPMPPGAEKYFGYTELACELNEAEAGVAPTDSRHRPDQRTMEDGDWDGANIEKVESVQPFKILVSRYMWHAMKIPDSPGEQAAGDAAGA